jgi:hypothetical protein
VRRRAAIVGVRGGYHERRLGVHASDVEKISAE